MLPVCFTERHGRRGAVLVANVARPSDVPGFFGPLILTVDAACQFTIATSAHDLAKARLGEFGERWA
jgi:hypothetical protein